jgi:hypothetical protein
MVYAGIKDKVKMVAMPLKKNTLIVRLENLADNHDLGETASTHRVAFKWLLEKMWDSANDANPVKVHQIDIKEKSLTGNMDLKEMLDRKIKWKTVDDDLSLGGKMSYHFDGEYVDLEPQRIRVFEVTFTPESQDEVVAFLQ